MPRASLPGAWAEFSIAMMCSLLMGSVVGVLCGAGPLLTVGGCRCLSRRMPAFHHLRKIRAEGSFGGAAGQGHPSGPKLRGEVGAEPVAGIFQIGGHLRLD